MRTRPTHRMCVLLGLMMATPALATGERVALVPSSNPLRESLCVSMNCVPSGGEVTVTARTVKGAMEFTVTSPGGTVRLVHRAPLKTDGDGEVSSTDLMRATTMVIQAIESPLPAATAPKKVAATPKRKAKLRMLARR